MDDMSKPDSSGLNDESTDLHSAVTYERLAAADAGYQPILRFYDWSGEPPSLPAWVSRRDRLRSYSGVSEELLARARTIASQAAAIETGAIEELYNLDSGITVSIATQAATWESALKGSGEHARGLIESQLAGYDYVLDLATGSTPISPPWIRQLHHVLCENQHVYKVWTPQGRGEHPLPLGRYKAFPNHVLLSDDTIHSYAPVHVVESEMLALCDETRRQEFLAADPIVQSAYVHHCLTRIHPFADGNGRVARAVASVYLYRTANIPLLVLADRRSAYLAALRAADQGGTEQFVSFTASCAIDATELVEGTLRAASVPTFAEAVDSIRRLHTTRGGFAHADVEQAGQELRLIVQQEFNRVTKESLSDGALAIDVRRQRVSFSEPPTGYRPPRLVEPERLRVSLSTRPPASSHLEVDFCYFLPTDCGVDDELVLICLHNGERLLAMMRDLSPTTSIGLRMRARMYAERVLASVVEEARLRGEASLRAAGIRVEESPEE